jgi:ribosomal protein L32E
LSLHQVWANRVKSFWRAIPSAIQSQLRDHLKLELSRDEPGFEMRPQVRDCL